jgi:hypothetical protein
MAIFHLAARVGSRGGGQSAAAAFAYLCQMGRDREELQELQELVLAESRGLPGWAADDPAAYWKAADRYERANGRLYQQVRIGLPVELSGEQQVTLAREFAAELAATGDGSLPYTLVVHRGKGRNPHAHVLLSERVADGVERSAERWFRRAAVAGRRVAEAGGARKTAAFQPRAWVGEVRARWAELANAALERAGHAVRIDPRSHRARGLDELPTVHEGPRGMQARERGLEDDRVARNAEIRAANVQLGEIRAHSETAQRLVEVLARELGEEVLARPAGGRVPAAATPVVSVGASASEASAEVLRFLEVHRKDFRTRAEAARWFDRETSRLRVVAHPTTARGLFEESLVETRGRAEFGDVLQQALVTPRWQEAPLSVGASIVQAEREIATWRRTAAEIEQKLARHRDGRSFWRRLLVADPELARLRDERDAAIAQVGLQRAALERIEARWADERNAWEDAAAAKNAARLERQRREAEQLREVAPEVLAELARREEDPLRVGGRNAEQVEYIRRRLARGMTREELWLEMLLGKNYSRKQQDELDGLIRAVQAERRRERWA